MRIPEWTPAQHPIPDELLQSILNRRGGALINLDKALLWSEPVARGWNQYVGAVRSKLPTSWKLRELGICTVALLTGATYEYHHHAPDFLKAGGTQAELDSLNLIAETNACLPQKHAALGELEGLVIQYAAQMTMQVQVDDSLFDGLKTKFSTTEIVELTTAFATYNMVARILVALKITPEH